MSFRNGCQHRWKLDYLEDRRSKSYGIHMDFGTAIHETLELKICNKPDPALTLDITVFLFKEKFKWIYNNNLKWYKESDIKIGIDFFLKAGENILRRFGECEELASAKVLYNEHELYEKIDRTDDVDINFKGFIDLVIKTTDKRGNAILYVCDFKTCSWGWPREKREDKNLHFQILLYKHFLCKKFDLDPKLVRTAFVLLKKKPSGNSSPVEWFPISAGPVSVQRAVDELNTDISEMHSRSLSGNFKKDRSQCTNAFGEVCPYKSTELCPND